MSTTLFVVSLVIVTALFFDFTNKPNLTPPAPPSQPTNGPCYINSLP